jgi:hypothetical protein
MPAGRHEQCRQYRREGFACVCGSTEITLLFYSRGTKIKRDKMFWCSANLGLVR